MHKYAQACTSMHKYTKCFKVFKSIQKQATVWKSIQNVQHNLSLKVEKKLVRAKGNKIKVSTFSTENVHQKWFNRSVSPPNVMHKI